MKRIFCVLDAEATKDENKKCRLLLVFVLLLFSLRGMALEDKKVIRGLLSGFRLNSASEESDEKLAEVLAVNCRLELIYLKQIYEDIGFKIPDVPVPRTGDIANDQILTDEIAKKALTVLPPHIKENLFKCLRENYLIPPVSGEDDSRRNLAKAPPKARSPSPNPSPRPPGSKHSRPKPTAPPPVDAFVIPIPVPILSGANDKGVADSRSNTMSKNQNSSHKTVIIAVVVTAVVTFSVASVLFLCCRKTFGGGSGLEHKDDRPLLSLSMSDSSVSGSSPKTWAFGDSVHKEKISSQAYVSNLSDKKGRGSLDGKLSSESASDSPTNMAEIKSSVESLSVASSTNASSSALKPPPGMPPLKPPPRRADPFLPEPPASSRPSPSNGGPPPPPPPAKAPAPPPPPTKRPGASSGPPPPPPPALGGKPGLRPPPPSKGGVAPPRPPPFAMNGSGDSNDSAAKAKLKPFFWDKVLANPDHSMVWDQIKSGSFQFNEDMIESLFGYTAPDNKNQKKKESSFGDAQPQSIKIIDQKKAQNLSILLRALNVTTAEVTDALKEGNELPSEFLETLLKMAPNAEEELKLRIFNGDISQLGLAERFLKVLVDIPFAFKRLEALFFMGTLQEEATTVKETFVTLETACKELRSSRLFLKLLEAVLKTGNRMNDGTHRGGAQAFQLDTLLKLADVKGTDGKTTLLHFVVQEIISSEGVRAVRAARESKSMSSIKSEDLLEDVPDDSKEHYRSLGLQVVSGLGGQLENVRKAACLDANSLTGTIAKLGNSLIKTRNFLNKEMEDVEKDNRFYQAMKSFVEHSEGDIMWLLEEEKRIMALVKSTVDYFHGNSGKEEGLRLFVVVRDFLIMLEKVCREVKERPRWPTRTQKREPPSRQTSTDTPRTPFSPDLRQRLFPAIAERRMDGSDSDDD